MKFSPNHHPFGIFHQKNSYTTIMVSPTIDSAGLVRTSRIPSWWRVIPIQIPEMVIVTGAKNQSLSGMILVETHSSTHDGSMVLLYMVYMVLHGSHQCTPFMLAYIYIPAPWIRHGVWSIGFIHHGKNWKIHARITMSAAYDLGGFGIMCSLEPSDTWVFRRRALSIWRTESKPWEPTST